MSKALATTGTPKRSLATNVSTKIFLALHDNVFKLLEKFIALCSLVGNPTFFDSKIFPWAAELESNWTIIREELDEILKWRDALPNFQDISEVQRYVTQDDLWKTYFLFGYGFKAEKNCERCPRTTALVEKIPGMKTAFFSILAPHKGIPPHYGPFKGIIRYHLGLIVPQPASACRIRVGDDVRHWEEGKSLVFDDTFEHQVWNDTDGVRVVLFLDVLRPMRLPATLLSKFIIRAISSTGFIQDAKIKHAQWEKDFEERIKHDGTVAKSDLEQSEL